MCLVVTCWERADLLALVCGVLLWVCYFPIGILGQVWYLIVSIPDLCTLTYFEKSQVKTFQNIYIPEDWLISVNSVEPDEMPYYAAFHLGLLCLPKYLFAGIQNKKG